MQRASRFIGLGMIAVALAGCGPRAVTAATSRPSPTPTPTPCPQAIYGKPCLPSTSPTPYPTLGAIAYLQPSSLSFIDNNTGWVVGRACDAQYNCRPGIARTQDGGVSWRELPSPSWQAVPGTDELWPGSATIRFTSSTEGWLFNPFLAHTNDGGASWQLLNPPAHRVVTDIVTFAGSHWALLNCPAETPCAATLWRNAQAGVPAQAAGDLAPDPGLQALVNGSRLILYGPSAERAGYLAVSSDGRSWAHLPTPCGLAGQILASSPSGYLMDVCWSGVGGGWGPKAAWTSSDGAHWTLRSRSAELPPPGATPVGKIPQTGYPNGIAMPTARDAWMSMGREDLYETHDGGITWVASAVPGQFLGNAGGAEQVIFTDASHGWAIGTGGLYATRDGHRWSRLDIIGPVPGYSIP